MLLRPQLELCVQVWAPQCKRKVELPKMIRPRAIRMIKGLQKRLWWFSPEKRRLRGSSHQCIQICEGRVWRRWNQDISSGVCLEDHEQWAKTGTRDVLSEHQETLLYCEVDWALAQVAQKGGGVPILRDSQKPTGCGPGQPALDDLAWKGGVDDNLQRSLSASPILRFCDTTRYTKQQILAYWLDVSFPHIPSSGLSRNLWDPKSNLSVKYTTLQSKHCPDFNL